jgi:hypothetical protein
MSLKTRRKTAQQKYKTPNNKTDSGPTKKKREEKTTNQKKNGPDKRPGIKPDHGQQKGPKKNEGG